MSTRSVIAQWTNRDKQEWAGQYHHWDGYPSALGATLYHECRRRRGSDMGLDVFLSHTWSTINGADWSLKPGYDDSNKATCATCGHMFSQHYAQYYKTKAQQRVLRLLLTAMPKERAATIRAHTEFNVLGHAPHATDTAKRPQCYCHGDRRETPWDLLTQDNASESGCEWAYVLDPERRTITILQNTVNGRQMVGAFGMGASSKDVIWVERAVVFVDNPEPDWQAIQS